MLVDAGPLVAAIDAGDTHHRWAKATLPKLTGRLLTCEAVAAEATRLLDNDPAALEALRGFLARMDCVPIRRDELDGIFARLRRFAPRMDLADGYLVALADRDSDAVVLTTDTRDFATYRVPFASPEGLFANVFAKASDNRTALSPISNISSASSVAPTRSVPPKHSSGVRGKRMSFTRDAPEILRQAKRAPGESFSDVVRRANRAAFGACNRFDRFH